MFNKKLNKLEKRLMKEMEVMDYLLLKRIESIEIEIEKMKNKISMIYDVI